MAEELKLCPFCDSPIKVSLSTGRVSCSNPSCPLYNLRMDEKLWQFRPIEDALRAKLDNVSESIKQILRDHTPCYCNEVEKILNDALEKINS